MIHALGNQMREQTRLSDNIQINWIGNFFIDHFYLLSIASIRNSYDFEGEVKIHSIEQDAQVHDVLGILLNFSLPAVQNITFDTIHAQALALFPKYSPLRLILT